MTSERAATDKETLKGWKAEAGGDAWREGVADGGRCKWGAWERQKDGKEKKQRGKETGIKEEERQKARQRAN